MCSRRMAKDAVLSKYWYYALVYVPRRVVRAVWTGVRLSPGMLWWIGISLSIPLGTSVTTVVRGIGYLSPNKSRTSR